VTVVHPAARAGATSTTSWFIGQFQGEISAQTPVGSLEMRVYPRTSSSLGFSRAAIAASRCARPTQACAGFENASGVPRRRCSVEIDATADVQRLPGDEGRLIGGKEKRKAHKGMPSRLCAATCSQCRTASSVPRLFLPIAVRMMPGQIAFTVVPSAPTSGASTRVSVMTEALVAA